MMAAIIAVAGIVSVASAFLSMIAVVWARDARDDVYTLRRQLDIGVADELIHDVKKNYGSAVAYTLARYGTVPPNMPVGPRPRHYRDADGT